MRPLTLLTWLPAAFGLAIWPLAAAETRAVALYDYIQMALAQNLDIRIQRYLPLFAAQDLRLAKAGYEPFFSIKLAKTNFERVDATRQARLYAEAALEVEQKKLDNGKSTSFVVLQLQRDLTSARSEEMRALSDYYKALSLLAQNEGSTLDKHNIDVQVE